MFGDSFNIWNIWIWAILWRFDRLNDTLLFYFNIRENFRKLTHVVLSGLSETVTHKDSVISHYHLFYDNVLELERKVLTEGKLCRIFVSQIEYFSKYYTHEFKPFENLRKVFIILNTNVMIYRRRTDTVTRSSI